MGSNTSRYGIPANVPSRWLPDGWPKMVTSKTNRRHPTLIQPVSLLADHPNQLGLLPALQTPVLIIYIASDSPTPYDHLFSFGHQHLLQT